MSNSSLFERTTQALKWNYLGSFVGFFLQFGIGVLLSRILGPSPFGLIGMATVVIGFGYLISGDGLSMALIQKKEITKDDIRACFTSQIILGLLFFFSLWGAASIVSKFYNEPLLTRILPVLGLSLFVQNLGMTAFSLLKRELNFKRPQIIGIISFTVGYGMVGTPFALMGYGVWSLVLANLVSVTLQSLLAYLSSPHSVLPSLNLESYKNLFRFGGKLTISNVLNYSGGNMDMLIIGKILGAEILGFYSRALYLTRISTDNFLLTLQAVTFPAYSKIQGQYERIGTTYKHQIGLISLIFMPLFWSMAICGDTIIVGLFGEVWRPAGVPFRILCLVMPLHAIMYLAASPLRSQDRVGRELIIQLLFLISITSAIWIGVQFGIFGVTVGVAGALLLRYFLLSRAVIRLTGIGWTGFFYAHVGGIILSIAPLVSLYVTDHALAFTGLAPVIKLGVLACTGFLSVAVSILSLPSKWFGEAPAWLYNKFGASLPNSIQKFVESRVVDVNVANIGN